MVFRPPQSQPRRGLSHTTAPSNDSSSAFTSGYADVSELKKYTLVENIGRGSFGVISKWKRIEDGKEFAVKEINYSRMSEKDRKQIVAEVNILESLKHRNIVQLFQKIRDPKNERIHIVMEFCPSGDLGILIRDAKKSREYLNEDKIWNIFLQILQALHHCHWPNERNKSGSGRTSGPSSSSGTQVLHRDLKPENVFLSGDFVKLGDFGLSKAMGNAMFTDTYVGTPLYMPPEILSENRYDTKSDIWSLGCLLHEMCTFSSPFATATTQNELIAMVKSGKLPPIPSHYSRALAGVIQAMLNQNPTRRPSTTDLLEMDEMKTQRKLFTLQNQTAVLKCRKDELDVYEARVKTRIQAVMEREKVILQRETAVQEREAEIASREEELSSTQASYNKAAEALKLQWDRYREENEALQERTRVFEAKMAMWEQEQQQAATRVQVAGARRSHAGPARRPPLEERNTAPVPSSSSRPLPRGPMSYDDTPSKIPINPDSPNPLDHRFNSLSLRNVTPLRKNNTKSMYNLRAEAEARATASDAVADAPHKTPAKRGTGHRSSIGSPGELDRAAFCEDVSMRTYIATPGSMIAGRGGRPSFPSSSAGSSSSGQSNAGSRQTSSGSDENNPILAAAELPSKIPTPSFIYREAATPAKWALDDPDLPSPFIRRASTAPVPAPATMAERDRQPLGSIFGPNPVVSAPKVQKKTSAAPRSRSGTLHRDVLRANAGRASGEGTAAGIAKR